MNKKVTVDKVEYDLVFEVPFPEPEKYAARVKDHIASQDPHVLINDILYICLKAIRKGDKVEASKPYLMDILDHPAYTSFTKRFDDTDKVSKFLDEVFVSGKIAQAPSNAEELQERKENLVIRDVTKPEPKDTPPVDAKPEPKDTPPVDAKPEPKDTPPVDAKPTE